MQGEVEPMQGQKTWKTQNSSLEVLTYSNYLGHFVPGKLLNVR